jgi:hypothetical protein
VKRVSFGPLEQARVAELIRIHGHGAVERMLGVTLTELDALRHGRKVPAATWLRADTRLQAVMSYRAADVLAKAETPAETRVRVVAEHDASIGQMNELRRTLARTIVDLAKHARDLGVSTPEICNAYTQARITLDE